MHTLNAIAQSETDAEDALKVLGRVADAFDNPSAHKTDKELKVFMVNVVKAHHLLTPPRESFSDEEHGSDESSFESDESMWEHAAYAPRWLHKRGEGRGEVTKMLLTSSPLDRLDRLARMELRKTGWIERVDKWTIVEMGVPQTPSKEPPRRREMGHTPEYEHRQIKGATPVSMRSATDSEDSPCVRRTRGRFGQVVRNIVRRMLPPPSLPETPRSDVSWSSGSASSWMEARGWIEISGLDAPPPPPKDASLYNRMFFSRSTASLASPESTSSPATPPSPFMPNILAELGKRAHNGSLRSFNRSGRDYLPSPSVDTDSSGSCPNHLGVYLSSNASSSSYTLGQESTVKPKKSVFKLANLTKRNKSKKDLSDAASSSGFSRSTSVSESEKAEGDDGISMPWNFQHHIHVDEGYIGLPPSWSNSLSQVGFSEDEIAAIHARRRAAVNLATPRTPDSSYPSPSTPPTMLEPAPRSTSLGKALTINPPSMYPTAANTAVATNSAPSPRTPSFLVKSFVNGIKSSLSSDPPTSNEDLGDSRSRHETGEEAEQYVFVNGNGPGEARNQGLADETLIERHPIDSSSVSSHHIHPSTVRQMSQDSETPKTPTFPQIQVHRAHSEPGHSLSPSPASRAPSPLAHSASLPIPTPSRGYTFPSDFASRPGPISAPPRTPPRRIYHIANASSDGEDYSEPPPAYASPKNEGWIPKEKEGFAPTGVPPPPPNRPIPSVPIEQTLAEPSHDSKVNGQAPISEHSPVSSVDIPGTADDVLDISSHYSDHSTHGEGAEMVPAPRGSVLTPTSPLVIDKRLTKLTTLPPRLSFHQEGSLEDWSASVFNVIGKGKRSSVLARQASAKERRTTIRPLPASASSPPMGTVASSLHDAPFRTNFMLGSTARPSIDIVEEEHSREQTKEDQVAETDADEKLMDKGTTTTTEQLDTLSVVPPTQSLPNVSPVPAASSLDKDHEPPAPRSPHRVDIENLPPTPPPKPKLTPLLPPSPITLVPPRTNIITGVSGRSPVNSLFGAKPQPLPIPISPSQIRAQLRPAPPKSPQPPPTLPLPPLRRIPSQPNPQPPPQSQLPPLPSPQRAFKHDFTTPQTSSLDHRPDSSQTLQPVRANQGDRDSGLSTVTVTPATITTAKTEVVRRAIASFIESDTVSLDSQRESILSTADPEPQTEGEPDSGKESPCTPETDDAMVSETSLLRDGPQSKWPAPPPPPVELETDSTPPRRVSRFRTTSLGRVTQLQAMASPVGAHFSHGSSDTASSSTNESTPLVTPDSVNGAPCAPLAKGGLAPEARLLSSLTNTFGGVEVESGEETEAHAPETVSTAMHPLLAQLQPFIVPRNPASCFTDLVEIAEGESGSVFAACVSGFGEPRQGERPISSGTSHVAIKRISLPSPSSKLRLSDDSPVPNKLVSVLHELSLLKDLDHEHLLLLDAIYVGSTSRDDGAESVDTSLWIRMELMERSLADVIGLVAEGLTLQERLIGRFASDILHGLDYLQRRHIAHRDVRSDNLLLNAAGVVKLADFSNAIRVDRNAPMVKGAVGVIYWQAPEMQSGSYNALKVDSWSLGATVWELAETVPPFSMPASPGAPAASFALQTTQHVGSQWPPLTHPKHYSRAFHEFLRLCGRESATRPGASELLNTPFIRNACGRAVILQLLSQCQAIEETMMNKEAGG